MAKQTISTGSAPNDGTGDSLSAGASKINANFTELYTTFGDGVNLSGFQGATGAQGVIGPQGASGFGPQGSQGPEGTGPQGAQGDLGVIGPQGTIGGISYSVTNDGSSYFVFNPSVLGVSENPTLSLIRGFTYQFNVDAVGHPFWIKTSPVTGITSTYDVGTENNGVQQGTLTFIVPNDAPSTLYYICQNHGGMVGTINVVEVGAIGPQGSQGLSGPQGAQGEIGTTGDQGELGPQGSFGPQGNVGPQGSFGPQGNIGFQGAQGVQGAQGFRGPQGVQGFQGFQGATGEDGSLGPQGAQGLLGPQGTQGLSGPQGAQGVQGASGIVGAQGDQGIVGRQGPQGFRGPQGNDGLPGGPQGSVGPQGVQGPQGFQGPQGTGPQGAQGLLGPQGAQGLLGPQGEFNPSTGLDLADDVKIRLGDGNDLELFHESSSGNHIINGIGTGSLNIQNETITLRGSGGSEILAQFTRNASNDLYYNNSKKFETTDNGVLTTGILDVAGIATIRNTDGNTMPKLDIFMFNDVPAYSLRTRGVGIGPEFDLGVGLHNSTLNLGCDNETGGNKGVILWSGDSLNPYSRITILSNSVSSTHNVFRIVSGNNTAAKNEYFNITSGGDVTAASIDVTGHAGLGSITVAGVSTFNGVIDCRQSITNGTVNSNIILEPNGTGAVEIGGTATITSINPITLGGSQGIVVPGSLDVDSHLNVSGVSTFSGDARVGIDTSSGVILTSPNGTQYRLIVDNSGNLSTVAV
jgi:hypothetical protein